MKKISYYLIIIFGAASMISSCEVSKVLSREKLLQKKWIIQTIDSVSNEKVSAAHAFIELSDSGKGGARANCNQLFFTYKVLSDDKIKFSHAGSTMMACPDMEAESHLVKLIPYINNYEFRGDMLIFKIDGREVMTAER